MVRNTQVEEKSVLRPFTDPRNGNDEDFFFPPALLRETAAGIPNAKLILYEGLGHNAAFSKRFNEDILALLVQGTEEVG